MGLFVWVLALFAMGGTNISPLYQADTSEDQPRCLTALPAIFKRHRFTSSFTVLKTTSPSPHNPAFSVASSIQGQGILLRFTTTWGKMCAQDRVPNSTNSDELPHES
ncbi:hypothetical protein B0T14DRAFT_226374 [Immersiella caudata]|uniref:Secreted protein n=1 Tax=Immersiella caudata TaxID=314043 RepID=A0AA39WRG8_9PEZI|nr:hypothetical protein B0T14DRAFT_226374 [Immersiella caudata]